MELRYRLGKHRELYRSPLNRNSPPSSIHLARRSNSSPVNAGSLQSPLSRLPVSMRVSSLLRVEPGRNHGRKFRSRRCRWARRRRSGPPRRPASGRCDTRHNGARDRVDVAHEVEHLALGHGGVEHGGRVLEGHGCEVRRRRGPGLRGSPRTGCSRPGSGTPTRAAWSALAPRRPGSGSASASPWALARGTNRPGTPARCPGCASVRGGSARSAGTYSPAP